MDDLHGYAAGGSGTILSTANGGGTWVKGSTGSTRNIYVASGASIMTAYAIGDTGLLLLTVDGGMNWSPAFAKTSVDLFGLHVLSDTVAWVSGDNGSILVMGTPTATATSIPRDDAPSADPESIALLQNYPNPFNPSTVIRYTVPSHGHVLLKAYSVLGQELSTLVDGWRSAGVHHVTFDADRTRMKSSGVVLFRLETAGRVVVMRGMFDSTWRPSLYPASPLLPVPRARCRCSRSRR
jgi:hypothetical protein